MGDRSRAGVRLEKLPLPRSGGAPIALAPRELDYFVLPGPAAPDTGGGPEPFGMSPPVAPPTTPGLALPGPVERALAELDPDSLTPREALEALYRLKAL